MIQKQIQSLLDKPMDRAEFLSLVGKGLLVIVGVTELVGRLSHVTEQSNRPSMLTQVSQELRSTRGFGASKFGI